MDVQPHTYLHEEPFPAITHSSSWSTTASSNTHQRSKSNNPFRQRRAPDVEKDESFSLRKKMPIRAVFDDLLTAHSSITSGKINTRTTDVTEGVEEEDSLHLQELDVTKRPTDFISNLPLPPLPLIVSEFRHDGANTQLTKENGSYTHTQSCQNLQPVAFEPSTFMFTNIRNAFAVFSSPLTKDDASARPTSSHWPRDSLDLDDNMKRRSLKQVASKSSKDHVKQFLKLDEPSEGLKESNTSPNATDKNTVASGSSVYRSGFSNALYGSGPSDPQIFPRTTYTIEVENSKHSEAKTPSPALPKPTLTHHFSNIHTASDDGSPREGSTVGNIYSHYIRSDEVEGASDEDFDSKSNRHNQRSTSSRALYNRARTRKPSLHKLVNDQTRLSALFARKERRISKQKLRSHEQLQKFSLPKLPDSEARCLALSLTNGFANSSSYGDTCDLLELRHTTNSAGPKALFSDSDAKYGLSSSAVSSNDKNPFPTNLHTYNSSNPFRIHSTSQNLTPTVVDNTPYASGLKAKLYVSDRLPLEREVSEALRRASGFSAYSNESNSFSALEHYADLSIASTSKSIGVSTTDKGKEGPPSDSESMSDDTRALTEQAKAFYDQDAITSNWLTTHRQNVVRVPIKHSGAMPNLPTALRAPNAPMKRRRQQPTLEDDYNDWETIGESGFGLDNKSIKDIGLIGGNINRAGSSLANTSDEGTTSPYIPEIQDFGSTERIAQHPGHIRYFGDYRQRDLKKTHIPVFLPVFREHKVNGYLADSTRIRPPPPHFNIAPPQLPKTHTNPFKSSPPRVAPLKRLSKRVRHSGHSQPSLQRLRTENKSAKGGVESTTERLHARHNWMENFGEPGPAISNRHHHLRSPSPKRPSSWRYIMGLASQRDVKGDGNNSSFGLNSSSQQGVGDIQFHCSINAHGRDLIKPSQEISTIGRDLSNNSQKRAPLVKGPPGAFYKGIRAKPGDSKRRSWSEPGNCALNASNGRLSISDYPTNVLRPLSLLRDNRPCTPITSTERSPSEDVLDNDFVYRSPLAPPKRDSWKQLYSTQQMQGILDAAKADALAETRTKPDAGFLQRGFTNESGSRKHLFETPTLRIWKRDESTRTDLSHQKTKFSIIVLCFCTLFPPMLMLYAWGRLDGIIQWLTNGTYSSFAKKQKNWALLLMCCWGVAVFLGLVAFLVYWFAGLHSSR